MCSYIIILFWLFAKETIKGSGAERRADKKKVRIRNGGGGGESYDIPLTKPLITIFFTFFT